MGETWRLVRSGHLTGARNMAIDEAVIESVAAGGPPTLRFYGWEPAAISLGYFQDFDSEVDEAACQSLGIDIVRRLTGGRAILHDVEVTYSLVISEAHPLIPRSITESYRVISEGLVRGLELLGLKAKMTVPPRRARGSPLGSSPACFDAPSWYEVTVGGKKIIGSAQVRRRGVVLQHGSIPLDLDADKLFAVLKFDGDAARSRAKSVFKRNATSIREALGQPASFLDVSDRLLEGLSEVLGVRFAEGDLTASEERRADELVRTRYATREWNERRGTRVEGRLAT